MMVVVLRRFGGNIKVNLIRFLTFMSFMMSWKSPPKALHSFSIPASIFPQARKNPPQTFYLTKKKKKKKKLPAKFWNTPAEESMGAFFFLIYLVEGGVSYNTPRAKSTFKKQKQQQWKRRKNTHGSKKSRSGLWVNVRLQSADATSRPTW